MASLILLVSQLLKHQTIDLESFNSMPYSSRGTTTATGAPCFTQKADGIKQPAMPPAKREEELEDDLPVLRICVDLVWP